MDTLPIDALLPEIVAAVRDTGACVVTAPPGSGKSTRVPPALARAFSGQIYLLQPRRIAAKTLAKRMASEQPGWQLGREVGYRVRFERVGTNITRVWVMTEGSLTRQLQSDPYLEQAGNFGMTAGVSSSVSVVIIDEFHERSLHTDLALAYLRELSRSLKEDLKIVVMSATMDAAPVAAFLGKAGKPCPIVSGGGRVFPVTSEHWRGAQELPLPDKIVRAVDDALSDPEGGDILVFLPGVGEIRACERALAFFSAKADIVALHGSASPEDQDRAVCARDPGDKRRIVLATNVAETALTIPGVRTVIDSGLVRVARVDAATGLDALRLETISRPSAEQRAGRAGRTAPGRCVRLWTPLSDHQLAAQSDPEIRRVDLAPTVMALKRWGYADADTFPWFEAPERQRSESAEVLLALLGASEHERGPLTPTGERLALLPLHPRLGRLLTEASALGSPKMGATLAALIGEREIKMRRSTNEPPAEPAAADALDRLDRMDVAERSRHQAFLRDSGIDPIATAQVVKARDEILVSYRGANPGWNVPGSEREADPTTVCRLLLAAYPDRVGRRNPSDPNRALLVGGVTVEIDRSSALYADRAQRSELIVAVEVQEIERAGRPVALLRQGAEIDEALLERLEPNAFSREEMLVYDAERQRVMLRTRRKYRDLVLRESFAAPSNVAEATRVLTSALRDDARALIDSDEASNAWLRRVNWLREVAPEFSLPEISIAEMRDIVEQLCTGASTRAEVMAKPILSWLQTRLTREQQIIVDEHAPSHVQVPTGNNIRLDYSAADAQTPPVLAVRLQELFGMAETPRLAHGRVPVLLHLLGPNYRVEQVTRDLASFWANTYAHVRKDLRGKYPKHSWPDDPLTADPQAKGRPRQVE